MRIRVSFLVATLLGLAFVLVLRLPGPDPAQTIQISNGVQLAAAMLATVGCAVAARSADGHRRTAWWWFSAGTGCWVAGQAAYTFYEVVLGRSAPFPSLADVGFLLFPLLSGTGLVVMLGAQAGQLAARGRDILDGAIIATGLLLLSWVTTLGAVLETSHDSVLTLLLALAYPLGDVVMATLVLISLSRAFGAERAVLALLGLGLGALAVSDSVYVYVVGTVGFSSTSLVSSGWVFGFLYVAGAGLSSRRTDVAAVGLDASGRARGSRLLRVTLPYTPVLAATFTLLAMSAGGEDLSITVLSLATLLVVIVLARQFLAMLDNERLLVELGSVRDALQHRTLHDELTGLANRVLFADRLDRALIRPGAHVAVMFCDLDDFKSVNDRFGHHVGDLYLAEVARRMLACVRVTDTAARLGGDEFAILLEDPAGAGDSQDHRLVALRLVEAIGHISEVGGHRVNASVSVGLARLGGDAPAAFASRQQPRVELAAALLGSADVAMYAAKAAGKGRVVLADTSGTIDVLPQGEEPPLTSGGDRRLGEPLRQAARPA